jgi:hypothetical protein
LSNLPKKKKADITRSHSSGLTFFTENNCIAKARNHSRLDMISVARQYMFAFPKLAFIILYFGNPVGVDSV